MPKLSRGRRLQEAYRFAGFFPASTVYGVFGNPLVRVLALRRRRKKQRVESVSVGTGAFTAYSDGCRTPIPIHIGQSFQFKADTCSD
jgi:hypothetical protein